MAEESRKRSTSRKTACRAGAIPGEEEPTVRMQMTKILELAINDLTKAFRKCWKKGIQTS